MNNGFDTFTLDTFGLDTFIHLHFKIFKQCAPIQGWVVPSIHFANGCLTNWHTLYTPR